jgi:hypothetical protein
VSSNLHPVFAEILNGQAAAAVATARALQSPLAAEFGDFLASRGVKATLRTGPQPQRPEPLPQPAAPALSAQERAARLQSLRERLQSLREQLQAAQVGFDQSYQACDDYSYWSQQAAKASRIAHLRRQVEQLEAA